MNFDFSGGGGGGSAGAQRNLFGGGDGGQRVTFRDSFGTAGNQGVNPGTNQFKWNSGQQTQSGQVTSQTPAMDMVNVLPKEMDVWEQTKMWPFSCLSVEKELPCLPEFHDLSVEEIRLEAYEAQKSGNMQAFNQKLQGIAHQYQTKRNQLRHMSMEVKQKLASFIDDARKKKANQSFSVTRPSSSIFGSATSPSGGQGLFGTAATSNPSTGLFGQSGSTSGGGTFGSGVGKNEGLFGKPAGQSSPFGPTNSTFGNANAATSVFGTQQRGGSLFGSQTQGTQQSGGSLFGSQTQGTQQSGGSLFGSQTQGTQQSGGSLFGSQTQGTQQSGNTTSPGGGLFGSQTQPPQTGGNSIFGQSTPGIGLFGQSQQSTGLFGKPASVTGNPQQNSVFSNFVNNNAATTTASPVAGTGLFGKPAATGSIFGQTSSVGNPPGVFGQNQSQNTGGLFGAMNNNNNSNNNNPATSTLGTGLFGKPAVIGGDGVTTPSIFSQSTQNPSAVAAMGSGGLFSSPVHHANGGAGLFGKGPQVSTGLFGNVSSNNSPMARAGDVASVGSGAGAVSVGGNKHFSSMEELSPQDIEAFKANMFVLGKIPIKPPPKELVII